MILVMVPMHAVDLDAPYIPREFSSTGQCKLKLQLAFLTAAKMRG